MYQCIVSAIASFFGFDGHLRAIRHGQERVEIHDIKAGFLLVGKCLWLHIIKSFTDSSLGSKEDERKKKTTMHLD